MKKLIILFGPPAVGKMTIGRELEKLTGLKLFHNHMTIEVVLPFFTYGSREFNELTGLFRREVFEKVAGSDLPGLIFTFVWALDKPKEKEFIDSLTKIFDDVGGETYYVELQATQRERLKRNHGADRLFEKPSKRNLEWSDRNLLECDQNYRLNTRSDEVFFYSNYLKLNTENLGALESARRVVDFLEKI